MAKHMEEVKKSLEELEKEITCAVCQDHYTEPKILPCGHYYCKQCILKLSFRMCTGQPFVCPECRKEAILPEGKVDKFPAAFFVNRLKTLYARQKSALNEENINANKCQFHNELISFFCFDCNKLICLVCTIKDHRNHDFRLKSIAATYKKRELTDSLKPLREMEVSLSHAVEEIHSTKHELEAQEDSVANTIERSFEELHVILKRRKQQLLEEARREVSKKMDNLEGQHKNISFANAAIRSILGYTEQCVGHCSDDEILSMHTDIKTQIKQEIKEHGNLARNAGPVEEVDIGVEVKCAEALQHLCQTEAKITQLNVNFVIDTIDSKAEVSKLSEINLSAKLSNNEPMKCIKNLGSHLRSLSNGSLIQSNIKRIRAGEYRIQYMPTVRGRHKLTLSIDGQQIAGSPFPLFASISPSLLIEPVKVWDDIYKPNCITSNSMGEIIISEYGRDIVVFNKAGKRLRSINCSEYKVKKLQSVAVDSEDNIYFVDVHTNRIFKSNKSCSDIEVYEVKHVTGVGLTDVAVVGDDVMVIQRCNEGRIMVHDKELKFLRLIVDVHEDRDFFSYLFPDHHNNLYISVVKATKIQVFSKDGEFLHSISCDKYGVKKLKSPWGVCVAGQHVFISDMELNQIVVFTTEGEYVTSFGNGKYGKVCVDQDGFVYACNFGQNKIEIY